MFDGITIRCPLNNFEQWEQQIEETAPGVRFVQSIERGTGLCSSREYGSGITYTYEAFFQTYYLKVYETHKGGTINYTLKINGSLHKNYYHGSNFKRFSYAQTVWEINHLCTSLHLYPERCKISVLEFGVNIAMDTAPINFIDDCVLLHKTNEFIPYEMKDGKCLGRYVKHTQYTVKVYDKGLQYDLPQKLMRVELRFTKMQKLNSIGIYTLADLLNPAYLPELRNLLLNSWENVLLGCADAQLIKESILVENGQYRDYWRKLIETDSNQFKYKRKKYREMVSPKTNIITILIVEEWERLEDSPNLPL